MPEGSSCGRHPSAVAWPVAEGEGFGAFLAAGEIGADGSEENEIDRDEGVVQNRETTGWGIEL